MEKFISNKAKDSDPVETVKRIKMILNDLGINVVEKQWFNNMDCFFSCRIEIGNSNVGVNGKGTTREFALASAYAEFMERVQNSIIFFPDINFEREVCEMYGFKCDPLEKLMTVNEVIEYLPNIFKKQLGMEKGNIKQNKNVLKYFLNYQPKYYGNSFVCLPFYNRKKDKIVFIPKSILDQCYRSNGMASGNTPEEAINQAICEIFERFAIKEVIKKEISPPNIPNSFLNNFPQWLELINRYEKETKQKVIIKDLSLGRNIPVIGVAFLDSVNNKYFIKIQSSPVFEIALERCFTELLQGKKIENTPGFVNYKIHDEEENKIIKSCDNISQIYKNGEGKYPNAFFSNKYSYEFSESGYTKKFENNSDLMKYCISIVDNLGYDIYIRDVSFLGFPAYRVIIPGMSESYFYNEKFDSNIPKNIQHKQTPKNINKSSELILNGTVFSNKNNLRFFLKNCVCFDNTLAGTTSLPVGKDFPLKNIARESFFSIAYCFLKDYKKAYEYINQYIKKLKDQKEKNNEHKIIKNCCIRDYIALKIKKTKNTAIKEKLYQVYGNNLVDKIVNDFSSTDLLKEYFPKLNCWNCDKCNINKRDCYYPEIKNAYLNIKKKTQENVVDQTICKNF